MTKSKTDKLLLTFILKSVITTILSLVAVTSLFSYIIFKLDLSLDAAAIISVIIYALCAFIVAFVSVTNLKNNGALMGGISQLPLILFSVFNQIFNDNTVVLFIIKVAISVFAGILTGYAYTHRRKRYKG